MEALLYECIHRCPVVPLVQWDVLLINDTVSTRAPDFRSRGAMGRNNNVLVARQIMLEACVDSFKSYSSLIQRTAAHGEGICKNRREVKRLSKAQRIRLGFHSSG
jgi:hypothetical protein